MKITAITFCLAFTLLTACTIKSATNTTSDNSPVNTNTAPTAEGTPGMAAAESPAAAAAAVVADLYKAHDGKKSPFFQTKNRGLVDKYFVKTLADLIWKDANSSKGEVGAIDGDPLYNAQDMDIKNFAVGKADVKGEAANVPVTFTNYGQKVTINYALKQEKGAWKIENILYGNGESLLKWLKDTYSENTKPDESPTGEFEGKYTVGPTFCIVKPVKMAFEVTWAKGSAPRLSTSKTARPSSPKPTAASTNSSSTTKTTTPAPSTAPMASRSRSSEAGEVSLGSLDGLGSLGSGLLGLTD